RLAPLLAITPHFEGAYLRGQYLTQERDAALVAIALVAYHGRHQAWPEQLSELVPDYLPAVPADRFDGQPLRYRLFDGQPRVYSVGPDLVDHGGQLPERNALAGDEASRAPGPITADELYGEVATRLYQAGGKPNPQAAGWDWLLWPPPESLPAGGK
ncbi:MAG TPA: hypothetical protein VMF30_17775, partial [Pirellulales bacterium]|nr:hypothetical protein [Pirellulales bacterium]